jgi:hypothetical protein
MARPNTTAACKHHRLSVQLGTHPGLWRDPETVIAPEDPDPETFMNVELLYSNEELEEHNEERKKPRSDANVMPDPYSI